MCALICLSLALSASVSVAEENRGLNISNFFKIKKAEEKDKYLPVEKKKEPALVLKGSAGPKMPAVPAGDIKTEVIVKTSLPPPALQTLTPQKKTKKNLPPTTLEFNPDIPYMTLIFQNEFQRNLEPGHLNLLKSSLQDIQKGYYRGKIQIKSFSSSDQKAATERAQKIRSYMISNGVPLTSLDVQAFPNANQGNAIHIFLLGEG